MDIADVDKNEYSFLIKTIEYLNSKTFLLKKSLSEIEDTGVNLKIGEVLCKSAFEMSGRDWDEYCKRVDGLIQYSYDFWILQKELEKTGKYLYSSFKEVEDGAYKSKSGLSGPQYIWGMYFSLFFWPSRNMIYNFFHHDFVKSGDEGLVLEVPIGAGMFMTDFLQNNKKWKGVGVDISKNSIDFSDKYLTLNGVRGRVELIKKDIYKFKHKEPFDKIISGDFLEHVEDPVGVLKKFHALLADDGRVFVSVAVWAANIDHIYLYKSAEDVRAHIREAGFRIEKESINNVIKGHKPKQEKTPMNYCAILAKV